MAFLRWGGWRILTYYKSDTIHKPHGALSTGYLQTDHCLVASPRRYTISMDFSTEARDWKNWVSLGARLTLGIVLMWAGLTKVTNLEGSVFATNAYQILSYDLGKIVGYALPFAEIALGLALIVGIFTRIMGALGALMMLVFVIAIASVWIRGISIDCGCFGSGGPIDPTEAMSKYPWEIARDIGLMACGVWLVIIKKPFLAIDSWLFRPAEEILARADSKRRRR